MISVQIQGFAELERKLVAMGPKVGLKAMRTALVSGSKVIKADAISRVPVKTGRTKGSILIKRLTKLNPFVERVIVAVRSGKKYQKTNRDAWYWKFSEFGTQERFHKTNNKSVGTMPKHPFIVPAFEAKKNAALDRIKAVLKDKIAKYAKERA